MNKAADGLLCHIFGRCASVAAGHEQPVVEAVDDGHQRGLIQIAADAGRYPRLMAVGDEADRDANVRSGIVRPDVECGDCEGAEAHLGQRRI